MLRGPCGGSSPEGVKSKLGSRCKMMRNMFEVFSSHSFCEYNKVLFVANHEEEGHCQFQNRCVAGHAGQQWDKVEIFQVQEWQ